MSTSTETATGTPPTEIPAAPDPAEPGSGLSRRAFFALSAAGTMTLTILEPGGRRVALADPLAGGTLAATAIPQFTDPLFIPPVMARLARIFTPDGRADYYKIAIREFSQQMLPTGLPATTVWGYGPTSGGTFHSPSMTIETVSGRPVQIKWINDLVDSRGRYRPHLLPVDPTLHWANPERRAGADGVRATDIKPDFTGLTYTPPDLFTDPATQYTTYSGPVPIATHVHGAMRVGGESDGYPEAWTLPAAFNIPWGYARQGRWWSFLALRAALKGLLWGHGFQESRYPNANRSSTLWFHDHTLGVTRLNLYAGLAGFWIVRGGDAGDDQVLDSRTGAAAVLPGPAPAAGDGEGATYFEIPLAIADRAFNTDGSLFYPDRRAFFDAYNGPFVPETEISPVWTPEFFGNTLVVNGRTWPYLDVQQARYRFRVLNGCQSRFLILNFSSIPGVSAWQIGNDGGLLAAPVDITGSGLLLSPSERADLIVDFSAVPAGNHVLTNTGPDEPYSAGNGFETAYPPTTGRIMQFRVGPAVAADPSTPPQFMTLPGLAPEPAATTTRRVALMEHLHAGNGVPTAALLGTVTGDPTVGTGAPVMQMWSDPVTENPSRGATEVWEIYNFTVDAHPVHIHETSFEVVGRKPFSFDGTNVSVGAGPYRPAEPNESGRKDTVIAYPGEVTALRMTFGTPGQYVWHCHIAEHEDNEMMRPFRIGPIQHGQPT
ncbi:MAG: multicopper oxidase family protein [Actinomycetales bacterium]